ncbi:MAG: InlB B-repeat-containing protein [Limisphaerales bacterium]
MKSTLKALALGAMLCSAITACAQTDTLTAIANPPQGGTITGGGTYTNGASVGVGIEASYGWYVSGVASTQVGWHATYFQLQEVLHYPNLTTIVSDYETLTLTSANTTLTATFSVILPNSPPVLAKQLTNQIVLSDEQVTLSASVLGAQPMKYQWQKNGDVIPGATNANLLFTNAQPSDSGEYSFAATNSLGFTNGGPVSLVVGDMLVFTNGQPVNGNVITVAGSVAISLESLYTNGSIFYTLDGSQPDFNATQYFGPFSVSTSGTLRAIAYSADFTESVTVGPLSILVIPVYFLSASTSGPGVVTLNPPGGIYESNRLVTIVAEPDSGWTFMSWSGAVGGTNPTNSITMTQGAWVEAVFGTPLAATVAGTGTVSAQPGFPLYPYGSTVRLSAVPGQGNYFARWGNAASGTQNPLSFTINTANPTVSALFAPLTANSAALTVVSDSGGGVAVSPSANEYPIGSTNVLYAVPYEGQQFLGWSGDASGTNNPLSLVMDTSKVVNAKFSRVATLGISASNKQVQLSLGGLVGAYGIEASTDLSDWVPLFSVTNFLGTVQFGDPSAQNFPYRMYKAVAQ